MTQPSPASEPPFLRLDPRIRRRIYRELGLGPWGYLAHRFYLHAGQLQLRRGRGTREYWRWVPDPADFHGLLLSCRAIYAEAAALLYSTSQFFIHYSEPLSEADRLKYGQPKTPMLGNRALQVLHNLTKPSLAHLSYLKVVLNQAACHQLSLRSHTVKCCTDWDLSTMSNDLPSTWCEAKHSDVHQAPLLSNASPPDSDGGNANDRARMVLEEWRLVAARLFPQVAPGHLAFSLVCDIDPQHPMAMELAKSIVAPMHDLLPRGQLKQCHIRLAKTPDRSLQQLAEDTVRHACGLPKLPGQATPTLKKNLVTLPRELRLRILEYTDLVTPRGQVIWDRDERAYCVSNFTPSPQSGPDEQHAGQFVGCWDAPYRDTGRMGMDLSHGCFCRRQHAAFSQGCKCWAPPGPTLFLLCRTLYYDAQFVFFSKHRFIVSDYRPRKWPVNADPGPYLVPDPPDYPPPRERFAVTEFLRHVPSSSLAYIRFLEVTIPAYRPPSIWPQDQDPALQDWRSTFAWARDKLNLPRLVIRFEVYGERVPRSYSITEVEAAAQVNTYMELLEPFKRLADGPSGDDGQGLGGFFAKFAWPYRWVGDWRQDNLNAFWGGTDRHAAFYEEKSAFGLRACQYVMGDRYDPDAEPPPVSDWDRVYHD